MLNELNIFLSSFPLSFLPLENYTRMIVRCFLIYLPNSFCNYLLVPTQLVLEIESDKNNSYPLETLKTTSYHSIM